MKQHMTNDCKNFWKLNKEKCMVCQREVLYVGHSQTAEGLKIDPQKGTAIHEMPEPKTKKM